MTRKSERELERDIDELEGEIEALKSGRGLPSRASDAVDLEG